MRSGAMAGDDATLRARIRDSAVRQFGRDGYAGTSIRSVAAEAGSSPALVLHHFGSKAGLRAQCDDWVVGETFRRNKEADPALVGDPQLAEVMRTWLSDVETFRPQIDYLARMLIDGGDEGERLFDRLVGQTADLVRHAVDRGAMHPVSDPPMTALLLTVHGVATLVLQRQISRSLGSTGLDADLLRRMTVPTLELYTHGLYRDDRLLVAARSALGVTDVGVTDPGAGS
ncbi:MAG: TetR family transcriptional regulator [Propionibacteriaceae bacterium]